ncbi:hypothetical protein Anapl_11643 [Anas platyrhynchos]|uniref:Uncharacterized protein n=1 Tax=Anas platyrhynchos TaxID=8839 RepID=R0LB90_ANAPL|nr:hypothetical protein Anapl_11643 [Anas platyrhynchos]
MRIEWWEGNRSIGLHTECSAAWSHKEVSHAQSERRDKGILLTQLGSAEKCQTTCNASRCHLRTCTAQKTTNSKHPAGKGGSSSGALKEGKQPPSHFCLVNPPETVLKSSSPATHKLIAILPLNETSICNSDCTSDWQPSPT